MQVSKQARGPRNHGGSVGRYAAGEAVPSPLPRAPGWDWDTGGPSILQSCWGGPPGVGSGSQHPHRGMIMGENGFFSAAPQVMITDLGPALPICPRMSLSVPGTQSSCSIAGSSEHHQVPCQGLRPAHLLQKLCYDAVCMSKIKKLIFTVSC